MAAFSGPETTETSLTSADAKTGGGSGHYFSKTFNVIFDGGFAAKIGASAFTVYGLLGRRANKQGHCHPSIEGIARDTGLGTTAVRAALRTLERHGMIITTFGGGSKRPNSYQVTEPDKWRLNLTESVGQDGRHLETRDRHSLGYPNSHSWDNPTKSVGEVDQVQVDPTEEDLASSPASKKLTKERTRSSSTLSSADHLNSGSANIEREDFGEKKSASDRPTYQETKNRGGPGTPNAPNDAEQDLVALENASWSVVDVEDSNEDTEPTFLPGDFSMDDVPF